MRGRSVMTKHRSALTEDQIQETFLAQHALEHAFRNVQPTATLMTSCYQALARAGVEALPVTRKRIVHR